MRFHDLRHSCTTWLVSEGVPPNVVQRIMGSEDVTTTLGIYTDVPAVDYVVYDTNIASLAFKVEVPASLTARLLGTVPAVSFVTVGELTKRAELRSWGGRRRGVLDAWLSPGHS